MRLDYRISYLLSVFKKEFVEVYPMQDSAADGTAPAFDSTSNPLSLLLVQLQLSKPPRLGTRALEVTAPAALHPRARRGCAGGMGGPVQEGWGVLCPPRMLEQGLGAGLVPGGGCQCTGLTLLTLFTSLPSPPAAAMNLERIGEHAEAMFGVG